MQELSWFFFLVSCSHLLWVRVRFGVCLVWVSKLRSQFALMLQKWFTEIWITWISMFPCLKLLILCWTNTPTPSWRRDLSNEITSVPNNRPKKLYEALVWVTRPFSSRDDFNPHCANWLSFLWRHSRDLPAWFWVTVIVHFTTSAGHVLYWDNTKTFTTATDLCNVPDILPSKDD